MQVRRYCPPVPIGHWSFMCFNCLLLIRSWRILRWIHDNTPGESLCVMWLLRCDSTDRFFQQRNKEFHFSTFMPKYSYANAGGGEGRVREGTSVVVWGNPVPCRRTKKVKTLPSLILRTQVVSPQ